MNLGLKLWSPDTDFYLEEARKLYKRGWFDYIELYVVPGTVDTIESWKILKEDNIPFTLHAPHFAHGFNLADAKLEKSNMEIFSQVEEFFNELNAKYVVVHSGMEGNIDETVRQLGYLISHFSLLTSHYLIENKPFVAPLDTSLRCRGAVIEEIKKVINEVGCGFCLDVGHAVCTYNSLHAPSPQPSPRSGDGELVQIVSPYDYLAEFNKLNPEAYHLSDNFIDSEIDGHMNFGKGNYDFKKIFGIIDTSKNMAIETNKKSKENLDDFIGDVKWLKNLK